MILPLLKGVGGVKKSPVTWSLFILNLGVFILLQVQSFVFEHQMMSTFQDEDFLKRQGLLYSQYVLTSGRSESSSLISHKVNKALDGDGNAQAFLGSRIALKDQDFLDDLLLSPGYSGDKVLYGEWRDSWKQFRELRSSHPIYQLGHHAGNGFFGSSLLSYQFAHSGLVHFALNMFFLLIFGRWLEPKLGPVRFLSLYLIGGVLAAQIFVLFNMGSSTLPLVGSSGAIGCLIGLGLALYGRRETSFFYYFGVLKMPFWIWALYFWILVDLTGWWRVLPELTSGVAHTAHLGGTLAGFLMGLALKATDANFSSPPRALKENPH